jgi:hypothetical protein
MVAEVFSYAAVADGNKNNYLETLWKEYEDASQKDYIQRMTNILEKIKVEALKERSSWDYYKAVCFYVRAKSEHNWKVTEELETQAQEEISAYGEPILDYLLRRESMSVRQKLEYLEKNADKLKSRKNMDVYEGAGIVCADVLASTLCDDYQYVLWDILTRSHRLSADECVDVYGLLSESLEGVYPQAGLAEYIYIKRTFESDKSAGILKFETLAQKYKGKALGVMINEFILKFKLSDGKSKGSSDYFRQMREQVAKLIKERDSFYGESERALAGYCSGLEDILKHLDAQVAYVTVKDADVQVAMRNLSRVKIKVSLEKETVFDTLLHNPVKSYYVPDTLTFRLPEMSDGDYKIECFSGIASLGESNFPKNTLSMSLRQDSKGLSVYVADYKTGEPLESVGLLVYKGSPRRKVAEYKELHLDGYTRLPAVIVKQLEDYNCTLECVARDEDGTERKISRYYNFRDYAPQRETVSRHSHILMDKPAYNPGEVLKFKAVIYERDSKDGSVKVLPSGRYTVKLTDANGEIVASKELGVNDFGSLAGEFPLKSLTRYGNCSISVFEENKMLGIEPFVVDEYVLPTFDVTFDKSDKVFYSGDEVVVRGRLESFAGHPLSSAKVNAVVTLSGKVVASSEVHVADDGTFAVSFNDAPNAKNTRREYSVEVKVTDGTGETHSYFYSQPVMVVPYLHCKLENVAEGSCTLHKLARRVYIVDGIVASIACDAGYRNGFTCPGIPLKYKVLKDNSLVTQGETLSGEVLELDFAGYDLGLYEFVLTVDAADEEVEKKIHMMIFPDADGDASVPECVENVFRVVDDENISLQIGAGNGPVWAVVELFSRERELLKSEVVHIEKGCLKTISYAYEDAYPGAVEMKVLYFRNSESYEFSHVWRRPVAQPIVPLKFARFTDKSLPGSLCSVSLQTAADVEAAASVYDISTEQINDRPWKRIGNTPVAVNSVKVYPVAGNYGRDYPMTMGDESSVFLMDMFLYDDPFSGQVAGVMLENSVVVGYGGGGIFGSRARTKYAGLAIDDTPSMNLSFAESESAFAAAYVSAPELKIRSSFAPALTFEPFLYPSDEGEISFDFCTSDKLSTFVVSVFAHDKQMNSNVLRGEMLVTMPVKLALAQPQYLYAGDRYFMKAAVSNVSVSAVSGDVAVEVYAGESYEGVEPMLSDVRKVDVLSGGTSVVSFEVNVPSDVDVLGFKVVFASGDVSDGVFVTVPVYERSQVIREVHSAVVLSGMSEEAVLKALRGRFTNGSSMGAEYSSLTVMDMLREALPMAVESDGEDAVSQSEVMYVNMLAAGLRASEGENVREHVEAARAAIDRLMACADEDGGFGWFKGMRPSPIITALVLERYAGLRDRGLLTVVSDMLGEDALSEFDEAVGAAVRYLDLVFFSEPDRPSWYGSISLWQYLRVRSMYAGVPFDKQAARKAVGLSEYIEFQKDVKSYLVPKKKWRWTDGEILEKARLISILENLTSSREGLELAADWGMSSKARMRKSMAVELESLKEYAVEHPSGGIYYPNAVLPFKGLLESEAYAHSLICDLFKDLSSDPEFSAGLEDMADGIRLWLMLQKETQKWDSDPGFVDAMASVYDASEAVKDTKVVILSKRFLKPFEDVMGSGNGFKVSVKYYKETADSGREELSDGDKLLVGDKIVAVYSLWSEDNRSFVRLSVPRPACFRPQDQLSGSCGARLRPISYGFYRISPYAYREVRADRTLYWIDVFPEEDSTVEEVLFVTQEGEFVSAVTEIESLYAPHYRANDDFAGEFTVE